MDDHGNQLLCGEAETKASERGSLQELDFCGLTYARLRDDSVRPGRGTVLVAGHLVPPFPSIGRIFVLRRGLERVFGEEPFWAEEKIDGYNVRIVRVDGRLLPLTRGGFVCPFTEDRLSDMADLHPLFDELPDAVLCCEVAGRDNPYIDACPPQAGDDVQLFAFDLMHMDREGVVPLTERDAVLDELGVPRARVLGRFHVRDWHVLREAVLEQHDAAAEGLIFKPPAEGLRVKYVTPSINVVDIVEDATLLAELPGEFFSNRLVRLCMGLAELRLDRDVSRLEAELGHGLISGFLETLHEVMAGGTVSKTFRVRVHSHEAADRVVAHMAHASSAIQVREAERRRVGDYVYLTFIKTYQHSTAKLKGLLDGQIIID